MLEGFSVTIAWSEDVAPVRVDSPDALLEQIGKVAESSTRDRGIGAYIKKESGEALSVIVAEHRWWLLWAPANYAEKGLGSYHSISALSEKRGDENGLTSSELIACYFFGHHGEVDSRESVSESECRRAVTEFFEREGRPTAVCWRAD